MKTINTTQSPKQNILYPIIIGLTLIMNIQFANAQKPTMQMAANIANIEYVDLVKTYPSWWFGSGSVDENYQFRDWNGNLVGFTPKSLRLGTDGSYYPHHSPIKTSTDQNIYPQLWMNLSANGTYTVIAEGKGKLTFAHYEPEHFSSTSNEYTFTSGTTFTFTITGTTSPDNSGFPSTTGSGPGGMGNTLLKLQITESDSLNPVRNIKVLPPDYTDSTGIVHHFVNEYTTKPFHPKFIEDMQKYTVLRFMDVCKVNNSKVRYWHQTRQPNELGTKSTPYIDMITLGNQANRDIWVNIPHLASNGFIDTLAQLIKANLKPSLKAYIEYSNEVWNTLFEQTTWASQQGLLLGWTDNPNGKFYVRRSSEVFKRFADIYKNERNRILLVCAWQMGGGNSFLGDYFNDPLINHSGSKPDAFAVAPYFYKIYQPADIGVAGECLHQSCASCVANNVPTVQSILDNMSSSIKTDVYNGLKYAKTASDKYHIPLINYEGGTHAVGIFGAENSCALTDNLMKANRHPRMADVYREWIDTLRNGGVQLLNQYFDCGAWDKWGAWGLEEYRGQDMASPKFKAVADWQKANPLVLDTQAPTAPGTPVKDSVTSTSIAISWAASSDNGTMIGYDIFMNGEFAGSSNCQVNNTKYTIFNLKPSTAYTFYVKARDFGGNYSGQSSSVTITTAAPDTQKPTAITNLQLVQKTHNQILIKWSPSADNDKVEKYIVSWGAAKDSTSEVSYLIKNLTASTYKLNVQAKDPSGNISDTSYLIVSTGDYPLLKAKQTKATIKIDGKLDEAAWKLTYRAKNTVSMSSTIDSDTISLGILWDANYLYFGARAIDPKLIKSASYWDGDGFEILIDGNNNKSKTYETGTDVKYTFQWNSDAMFGTDTIGVLHKMQNITGGFTCEIAIPWSKLGITTPAASKNLGFDMVYNDADYNEWGRTRQYTIIGDESIYTSCEQFTTLTLVADTVPPVAPSNIIFADITMCSASVSWSATSDDAGIKGYNVFVNGKQANTDIVATTIYSIEGLQPGTQYTISVCGLDKNFNTSNKSNAQLTTSTGNALVSFNGALNTTTNYSLKATVQNNTLNNYVPFSTAVDAELFGKITDFNKQFEIKGGFNYEHTATPPTNANFPSIIRKGNGGQADGLLYVYTGEATASNFTGILMWTKEKFLNGNNTFGNIAFDNTADSRLYLKTRSGQFGKVRFVVKTTSNYYISESVYYTTDDASGYNIFALNNFGNNGEIGKRWALYDPTTLKMPGENTLNFAAANLSDIQEVGIIFSVGRSQWSYSFGLIEFSAYGIKKVTDTQAPSKPTGVRATNLNTSSFTLNWDASTDNIGVVSYDIYENNNGNNTLISSTTSLNVNLGGLASNSSYNYRVQARDRAGNKSELSDIFSVTTNAITDVKQRTTKQISIYPNPANEKIIITGASVHSQISVFNIQGKLQLQVTISGSEHEVNIRNLPMGMYIVKISNGNTVLVGRFIKK